jgi:ribosomal protein S18 acetylase RimI-like enzyme
MTKTTTFYLEMTTPEALIKKAVVEELKISECEVKQYSFNKFLYQFIGESWQWLDKLSWSNEQWKNFAENDNLRTWVAYLNGSPAGYFELQKIEGDVEILYFGLAPAFIGKGYGGYLLSHALKSAWAWQGAKRVWVHTCTLDHPGALQNYKARGMSIYKEEID